MAPTLGWKRKYGSLDVADVVRRFTVDGTPGTQIARDLKVRRGAIYAILKKAGVDNQRGGKHHPPSETRRCTKCRHDLPLGAFGTYEYRNKRVSKSGQLERRADGHVYRSECRECYARRARAGAWTFTATTGLTVAQYESLRKQQGGVCAICGGENNARYRLGVDHDHRSYAIRGLLCHRCNSRLAAIDDAEWLDKALAYLRTARTPYRWADREHNARVDTS